MKVSVAMITYNQERFIGQAIESVLAQRVNFEYEIVIGEDCSTDGTRAVVLDFHRRFPERIRPLLREQNMGGPHNFWGTLAACRGQYLAILEGDDYWTYTDKLQRQVVFLDAHPGWAICCSRAKAINELGTPSEALRVPSGYVFPARPGKGALEEQDLSGLLPVTPRAAGTYTLEDLLMENFIPTCTVVYRWGGMPRFPSRLFESVLSDLPRHAIVTGEKKIELFDDCTAVYRIHSGGVWSSRDRDSQVRENARMLAALNRHFGDRYDHILGPKIAHSYLDFAMTARQQGRRAETARHVISCIRNGGLHLPVNWRTFAGLAAYALIGSWYKVLSRADLPKGTESL